MTANYKSRKNNVTSILSHNNNNNMSSGTAALEDIWTKCGFDVPTHALQQQQQHVACDTLQTVMKASWTCVLFWPQNIFVPPMKETYATHCDAISTGWYLPNILWLIPCVLSHYLYCVGGNWTTTDISEQRGHWREPPNIMRI